jgi:hypothetical protein
MNTSKMVARHGPDHYAGLYTTKSRIVLTDFASPGDNWCE